MPDTRYCPKCGEACGVEDRFCTSCRTELRATPSPPGGSRASSGPPHAMDGSGGGQTEMGLPANAVLLDRYKILKLLGAGGMGRVYLAEDQKLGIPVAIKVLRDILTQDPVSVKRLITEAKTSILLAHPNIVRLHNFEDGETTKFLVMEYVEGETLDDKIANQGKLSEEETRTIAVEVCKGLEHAHQKKVIHRDMKPGNVMLGKDGSIKISDFGLARLCHDSIARMTSQLSTGTLQYMSPEQLDGEISELSDLYSVGIMLYEMLSGAPPFVTGDLPGQIRRKVPRPIEGVSPEMNRIVLKCIEKNKENRFASVRQLREELDGTVGQRKTQVAETEQHLELLKAGAASAFDGGKYAESVALWQQALAIKPGDPALTEPLRRAQEQLAKAPSKPPAAEEKTEPASKEDPNLLQRLTALKTKGKEAGNAGRFGEAIAAYHEALALNPGDAGLNEALADARKQADLVIKEAERKKGEEARKQWLDDVVGRVNALFQKGTYRDAENLLHQALQHVPNNALLMEQLAKVREKLKPAPGPAPQPGPGPGPEKIVAKPKRWKKILVYTFAGIVLLGIIGYIKDLIDNGSDSGDIIDKVPDVAGYWTYTITAPNVTVNGRMQISGSGGQLQLSSQASYPMILPDGFMHQISERYNWVGTLNGRSLSATFTTGTYMVDAFQYPPPMPQQLNLQLSNDGLSLQGQIQNPSGSWSWVAYRQ